MLRYLLGSEAKLNVMVKIRRLLLFNGPRDWSEEEEKGLGNRKIVGGEKC